MNELSINGGASPVTPAPTDGGFSVIPFIVGILVIIAIIIGVVLASRPASKVPSSVTPAPILFGASPSPSMGREASVSNVVKTPEQQVADKRAQEVMRQKIPDLTNEQIARIQRDAGKEVDIRKQKLPEPASPSPSMGREIGLKIGVMPTTKTPVGIKGGEQIREPPKTAASARCYPGWDLRGNKCYKQCLPGEETEATECGKCPDGSFSERADFLSCRDNNFSGRPRNVVYYNRNVMPAMV